MGESRVESEDVLCFVDAWGFGGGVENGVGGEVGGLGREGESAGGCGRSGFRLGVGAAG